MNVTASALARAGLLGNPSDLYGGAGVGFTFAEARVDLTLKHASTIQLDSDLLRAAWQVFRDHCVELPPAAFAERPFAVEFRSSIPRQVGLAGSSAIVMAMLRALALWFARPIAPMDLARLALRAEVDHLGIRAGPMDRIAQAYEGLLAMDFAVPFDSRSTRSLDPHCAPPMCIAYDPNPPAKTSGGVHAPVYERWQSGDPQVRQVMAEFRPLVAQGIEALSRGDHETLRACVNRNFDLRASLFPIRERDRQMIQIGRQLGAATKFCGSGGAVLVVPARAQDLDELQPCYRQAGFVTLRPTIQESKHAPCT